MEEDYRPLLEKKFPKGEIDGMVRARIEKYGGLITEDIALFLLAKENDLIEEKVTPVSSVQQWMRNIIIQGKISHIFPAWHFEKNGKKGRSCRLLLSDKSGEITVVLWNDMAKLTEGEIGVGDEVEVRGGYVKDGELHIGYGGKVTLVEQSPPTPIAELKAGVHNVRGKVNEVFLDYFYMRGGKEEVMSSFLLSDETGEMRVVVWKEPARVRELGEGDEIKLEKVLYRNNELHVNASSRIVITKKKQQNVVKGKIEEIEKEEKGISAVIGGKRIVFDDPLSLKVLGVTELPPDVPLKTVLEIKKKHLLEKEIAVRISQREGALFGVEVL